MSKSYEMNSEKRAFLAGFQAGAIHVVRGAAKEIGMRVKPWNPDDDALAESAYIDWRPQKKEGMTVSDLIKWLLCRQECPSLGTCNDLLREAADEIEQLRDEWYSPEHMEAVESRTIQPLRAEIEQLRFQRDELGRQLTEKCDELKELQKGGNDRGR